MPEQTWRDAELFIVPDGTDRYYLYAPLRRSVALVNGAAAAVVARHLDGEPPDSGAADLLAELREAGLLGDVAPEPPLFPTGYAWQPHEVTLFLTSRCNLRCRYCYADAGCKSVELPWPVAQAAIDLVAEHAGLLGSPSFGVGFHGGGEPTVAWDLLTRCVDYAHQRADEMGLRAQIFTATNGLLDEAQRRYLAERFESVTVSLDGPPDIQNHQRPRADGQPSYPQVAETLRHFGAAGLRYSVRATITAGSVDRLPEIVEHLGREFGLGDLHVEPAWGCGRCLTTGESPPDDDAFVARFLEAVAVGERFGVSVHYSGARLDQLTSKFCAAPGDGFSVLPEGLVTSCFEITEADDPRAAVFHYGRFDAASGRFVFDPDRLAALQGYSVEHLDHCRDCFCKWHCAGDCLAKVFSRAGAPRHEGSPRCELNRALTRAQLAQLVAQEQAIVEEAHHG